GIADGAICELWCADCCRRLQDTYTATGRDRSFRMVQANIRGLGSNPMNHLSLERVQKDPQETPDVFLFLDMRKN
ncbi:MAG: hypothetical protein AAF399_23160, partial [Bacteroidota bacterium]